MLKLDIKIQKQNYFIDSNINDTDANFTNAVPSKSIGKQVELPRQYKTKNQTCQLKRQAVLNELRFKKLMMKRYITC